MDAGVYVQHHSALHYLAVRHAPKSDQMDTWVALTINDTNVLQDYHTDLIPKAVEYSAGILDYFFRGRLQISCLATQDQAISFCVRNLSGQTLSGGTFGLYGDDATTGNGAR